MNKAWDYLAILFVLWLMALGTFAFFGVGE